ncbi:peptidase T [Desulfitobacterium metallireducens]|uniref:Peptidase T n=1 Tax=Desulfitobacterium metallireducens DSM 15288 TaxID=871968 RepID=W0EDC9_9FIRM|nr:peptidase T [Desulfitobacterium metallireducens]AHF07086.1 peptidase T [Desulfitobacterium metallireducens DSM 15288]
MNKVIDRFLKYVQMDTQSDEGSTTVPSTSKQLALGKILVDELKSLGLQGVKQDEKGYVYATLPANITQTVPAIGFIAHMDTSPDISGHEVKPQLIKNYPGGDIVLNPSQNIILSTKDFPELNDYIGADLITTDGTTLLGADDKAGIAEIMAALEYLNNHPDLPHGKLCIGFTPDEEIGRGADHFDVKGFAADFAYTVDGGPIGELEYENFNAAKAVLKVHGRNVHPGSAKGKMINSLLLANEFISLLPQQETPAHTEGYEGFYHLNSLHGDVEETVLDYILRDFESKSLENRKDTMKKALHQLQQKYGEDAFTLEITDQYQNMREKIEPVMHIVKTAQHAMEAVGVKPNISPIRGGTDGARLSYMGLPTPNLFTGGHNFHGKYEFIPSFALEKGVEVILKIIELYSKP